MSWIVQSVLNNRERIREEKDIESDEFNDLLLIEKAVHELYEKGVISEEDLCFIGFSELIDVPQTSGEKQTFFKKRAAVCDRIAYYLGGYFTDDGYLSYIQEKYKLDEDEVNSLRKYINSKYKHKILRKPIHD